MMDGRVGAIRSALDERGLERSLIMSYSAKFHSRFYGPFRAAADSAPKGGVGLKDRATYQIDPGSPRDAFASSWRDAEEGADILMVKPGLPYLDMLARLSDEIPKPWAVYEVSGEYAAIELLAREGLMPGPAAHVEAWTAFVRAGASMIITYGARYARQWLEQMS
jgi:porphobilinogen synthase